jgi:hypothetical protein
VLVSDQQVSAFRAYVIGDFDQYRWLSSQLDRDADQEAFAALVVAGFFEAVDRRFADASDEVIEYVGSVRARSDKLADKVDPQIAERLIRHALGDGPSPNVDSETRTGTQLVLLTALVHDSQYDKQELEQFLAATRRFADQMMD